MKYLLPLTLLLTGCGTLSNPLSSVYSAFRSKTNELSPEQIAAIGNTVSHTSNALSVWVYAGIILFVAGIIMLAFSLSKYAGIIFIIGGVACSFAGHLIEDYAHYVIIAFIASGLAYGSYTLGNRQGYQLGYKDGEDYMENDQ